MSYGSIKKVFEKWAKQFEAINGWRPSLAAVQHLYAVYDGSLKEMLSSLPATLSFDKKTSREIQSYQRSMHAFK